MADLPGEPLGSGFTYRQGGGLSRAALKRVLAKRESSRLARLRAMAESRNAVLGAGGTTKVTELSDDDPYDRLLVEAVAGCCMDDAWRGRPCQYHQGFADGLEAMLRALRSDG